MGAAYWQHAGRLLVAAMVASLRWAGAAPRNLPGRAIVELDAAGGFVSVTNFGFESDLCEMLAP